MAQINYSFGSGGMDTWFTDRELSEFLNFMKAQAGQPLPVNRLHVLLVNSRVGTFGCSEKT